MSKTKLAWNFIAWHTSWRRPSLTYYRDSQLINFVFYFVKPFNDCFSAAAGNVKSPTYFRLFILIVWSSNILELLINYKMNKLNSWFFSIIFFRSSLDVMCIRTLYECACPLWKWLHILFISELVEFCNDQKYVLVFTFWIYKL